LYFLCVITEYVIKPQQILDIILNFTKEVQDA